MAHCEPSEDSPLGVTKAKKGTLKYKGIGGVSRG